MCWSRSGQPHGQPGIKECDSCSLSPREEKVLLSSLPFLPAPSLLQPLSDPSLVVLTWQRTLYFFGVLHWLLCWPGSWVTSQRQQGRQGRGALGAQICWISFAPTAQLGKEQFLFLGSELASQHFVAFWWTKEFAQVTPRKHPNLVFQAHRILNQSTKV